MTQFGAGMIASINSEPGVLATLSIETEQRQGGRGVNANAPPLIFGSEAALRRVQQRELDDRRLPC